MPTNSVLTIHKQTVMVHPIIDKYYSRNPNHFRSSAFVQTKGLVANEKVSARAPILPDLEGAHGRTGVTVPLGARVAGSPPQRLSPLSTGGGGTNGPLAQESGASSEFSE